MSGTRDLFLWAAKARLLSLLSLSLAVLAQPALAETLTVSAAASLADAVQEIATAYERGSKDRIELNFGASNLLARQIEQGAPVDVFLSADEASADRLGRSGLLAPGTRRSILSNTLVVVVETDSPLAIRSPRDLVSGAVHSLALAEPGSVPAGIYAREYLRKIGIWDRIEPIVIPTENVRAALAAVEAGNADAAIVYRTDAGISKKVRVAFEVPAAEGPRISYAAAVVRETRHRGEAEKFLSFLESPAASAVFLRFGFLPGR